MGEFLLVKVASALVEPPGLNLSLAALGGMVRLRWRRLGVALVIISLVALYLLSTSAVADALLSGLQPYPALEMGRLKRGDAAAIVVLAAGRYANAPEYGGDDTVSDDTLERLRYGARLYRETGLPLLLTGGAPLDQDYSLAFLMKEALEDDFRVPVVWTEEHSRTTWENAQYSKGILDREGIHRVYLVTHAWHMPRAVAAFRDAGLDPIPAPTGFVTPSSARRGRFLALLPSARALHLSALAVHEYLGLIWYRLRH
jgi:uncharacterized SAM-binding protein YcdF (DUF218 family)